jgi:Fur family ferric uptake transcriptional regulator
MQSTTSVEQKIFEEAKAIFTQYLDTHKQRRTPERFKILEEIYKRNTHFDAEELYIFLKSNSFNISRATVYNTLELLVNSELITKHQFGQGYAQYEKSYGSRQHDHIICLQCGRVMEFCDPRIHTITSDMENIFEMKIKSHAMTLFAEGCGEFCKHIH